MRRPRLEQLEDRCTPATLDLASGSLTLTADAANNNLTQYANGLSLVLNDPLAVISLTPPAVAAGWKGSGTHTVTGPRASLAGEAIDLGGGTNVLNLRACDVPVSIDCTTGTNTVNVSSNAPTNSGSLATILGDVTITGDGDDSLVVSDQGATSGNGNVLIDPAGIHRFAGPADDVDIWTAGTFAQERATGSSSRTLAESFTVAGSAGPLRLDTRAGHDTVDVAADTAGTCFLGDNGQTFTVEPGATWTGGVHTGPYAVTVNYGPPTYGDITGTVGL